MKKIRLTPPDQKKRIIARITEAIEKQENLSRIVKELEETERLPYKTVNSYRLRLLAEKGKEGTFNVDEYSKKIV